MTRQEREQAVERESLIAVEQFILRSQQHDWSLVDLPVNEMQENGQKLSSTTGEIARAFMGIEKQLPNYMKAGRNELSGNPSRIMLLNRWGFEEERHEPTLRLALVESGINTEEEIDDYNAKVLQKPWSNTNHQGMDNALGSVAYTMFQERATYINYRGLLRFIRQDYGLPQTLTDEERKRGQQVGAAEAIDKISKDELGHHVINLQIVRIYHKYFPEYTEGKIRQVLEGFRMPALDSLPNRREFIRALARTRIYDGTVHRQQVVEPILKALNLAA